MKRHLLTLAIAASLLPLAAQAAPRVYGQLNLSVDYMDADVMAPTSDVWALNSNSSRIGVKGSEKLTEEYTAVYKMEWEVAGDMKGGSDLDARERYIGIKHYQWGTVRLGYMDSPFKNAEDDIDVFNDLAHLDMGKFIYGQNRLANSINYVSPKFLDVFGANITIQPGEQGACSTVPADCNQNHLADGYSTAFSYEDDSLYLSYAMDKEIMDSRKAIVAPNLMAFTPSSMDAMRFNARYKMGDMMLSGMYQMAEPTKKGGADTIDQEDSFVISASYKMDMMTIRGEVLMSTQDMVMGVGSINKSVDTTLIGVGVDYNITENTKVFGNVAMGKNEVTNAIGAATDYDTTYLGVGTEVRF